MFAIKAYNFSHDNDSYNQCYYKLKFLENHNKKIRYLILGIDYFQFSFLSADRNYIYIDLFDEAYAKDFNTDKKTIKYKFLYYWDLLLTPSRLQHLQTKTNNVLKENGQYIQPGTASLNDSVTRDYSRLPIQIEYFSRILKECESNNIPVFLVMPPLRDKEYNLYSQETLADYEQFFKQYTSKNVFYLNYSINHNFTIENFSDITHLKPAAADIFSRRVSDDINSIIQNNLLTGTPDK